MLGSYTRVFTVLYTGTRLTWKNSWFHWTFELMAKKPHIPQSLKSLIEAILGR